MKLILHNLTQKETLITVLLFFALFLQVDVLQAQAPLEILYRVNAGGPEIEADPIHWGADQAATSVHGTAKKGIPSEYLTLTDPDNEDRAYAVPEFSGDNETIYPDALFATERFSSSRRSQSQTWDFPVSIEGTYTVNLLFAEIWDQAQAPGVRLFGISVEGNVVEDSIDLVAEAGWNTATVKSFEVEVNDGNLDISLRKRVQNPAIKGIEIIGPAGANINLPPRFTSLPLVRGEAGQTVSATFTAEEKDGDAVAMEISIQDQNGNAVDAGTYNFTDNGDGTGDLVWETQETDKFFYVGTITASDKDGAASKEFPITISEKVQLKNILYRVNAGGSVLEDLSDPERIPFSADTNTNPSEYVTEGSFYSTPNPVSVNTTVPGYVPLALFQTERYQQVEDNENMVWSFPVDEGKMVNVRIYMAEIFLTADGVNSNSRRGPRIFDIIINEDTVETSIDVFAEVGENVGIMRSYNLISPGNIDISFGSIAENPSVKGIEILEIEPLEVSVNSQDAVCFGGNGSATVEVNGGIGPYEVIWGNGVTPNQLLAGTYTVTIKDGSGQQKVKEVTINQPEELTLSLETTNATAGASDGSASAVVEGGAAPYTLDWGEGIDPEALPAGNYTLTVTDANGCIISDSFVIGAPDMLVVDVKTSNPVCYGGTGSAEVIVSGGTEPYEIVWTEEVDPSALPAGEYTVTITDNNGQQVEKLITITEPETELKIEINTLDASNFGANDGSVSLDVSGGTSPYNIFWGDIDDPNALSAGTYTVRVKDAAACEKEVEIVIGQPAELTADITTTIATCDTAGTATVNISGGTFPYEVLWSNDANPDSLAAGTYQVEIIDANGVRITREVEIILECDDPLSTNEPETENLQLKLYPVPGDDMLNIVVPTSVADKEGSIRIYTIYGQKILEQKVNTFNLNTVNVSHFRKGTYIIEVATQGTILKSRFLIGK